MRRENTICYLGDDGPTGAAAYLCGVMAGRGFAFERVDSGVSPGPDFQRRTFALYVVSDYPRAGFQPGDMERIAENVRENGSGLLMLGGWESFFGRLGEYPDTPLADVLPVELSTSDDRRNDSSPTYLRPTRDALEHPILKDLPWKTAPSVGGFNAFSVKPGATVLLEGIRTKATWSRLVADDLNSNDLRLEFVEKHPFLVVDDRGKGRVAAFASDVAPHWVGGMVDWGRERFFQELPPALGDGLFIEVGADYARFFGNLVRWTANF